MMSSRASLLQKDLSDLLSCEISIDSWKQFIATINNLRIYCSASVKPKDTGVTTPQLVSLGLQVVDIFFRSEVLSIVFQDIFRIATSQFEAASKELLPLISGSRVVSNCFHRSTPENALHDQYNTLIQTSFVHAIVGDKKHSFFAGACSIVFLLPKAVQPRIIWELCAQISVCNELIRHLSPNWSMSAVQILLRILDQNTSISNQRDTVQKGLRHLMVYLIANFHITEIVERLTLDLSLSKKVAGVIVTAFPKENHVALVDTICTVWSDKGFIASGDSVKQALLTDIILLCLKQLSIDDINVIGARNISVGICLSIGISNYLDSADQESRLNGMRIAKYYATLMGQTLSFSELDKAEQLETAGSTFDSPSSDQFTTLIEDNGESLLVLSDANDSSGSDDSDIEGYDIPEEEIHYKDKYLQTNYLRDCLEFLRCATEKDDAQKRQLAALRRIPIILEHSPTDSRDMCSPLVSELLSLSNQYNIDEFCELQSVAILAFLVKHVDISAPILTASLHSENIALGRKIDILKWLSACARVLSAVDRTAAHKAEKLSFSSLSSVQSSQKESAVTETSQKAVVAVKQTKSTSKSSTATTIPIGKTTIKRPGKLAASKRATRVFRNEFATSGAQELFFHSVLQLLAVKCERVKNPTKIDHLSELTLLTASSKLPSALSSEDGIKHLEGLDALIPTQCLYALATFTESSIHTRQHITFAQQTMQAAYAFKDARDLALRRAALCGLLVGLQAWQYCATSIALSTSVVNQRGQRVGHIGGEGILSSLCNVSRGSDLFFDDEGGSDFGEEGGLDDARVAKETSVKIALLSDPLISSVIDWVMNSVTDEHDLTSKILKQELLQLAVG